MESSRNSPPPPPPPHPPPSLRTELLVRLAVLAAAALLLGVVGAMLLVDVVDPERLALYVGLLVAADVAVFIAFTAQQLRTVVLSPLRDAIAAAESIAAGDLDRRVPAGATRELVDLGSSVNRMTDRLLEERAQLVRAEKLASIGRLAAGVAHEIGNPLGALTGYAHVLRSRVGERAELAEVVTGIERESGRIDRIVRGLLDYSRARPATPTPVDVRDAIRGAAELLAAQGVVRRVALDLRLGDAALVVHGQRHDMEQLFVNLLLNAVDAMAGEGSVVITADRLWRGALARPSVRRDLAGSNDVIDHPPSARAKLWLEGNGAEEIAKIVVADSGPGIPPELTERVFDPFFTTKEPGKGTGLGLAIVARIVDNFHGTVWVTRAREGGAAVHLLLPLAGTVRPSLPAGRATPTLTASHA